MKMFRCCNEKKGKLIRVLTGAMAAMLLIMSMTACSSDEKKDCCKSGESMSDCCSSDSGVPDCCEGK